MRSLSSPSVHQDLCTIPTTGGLVADRMALARSTACVRVTVRRWRCALQSKSSFQGHNTRSRLVLASSMSQQSAPLEQARFHCAQGVLWTQARVVRPALPHTTEPHLAAKRLPRPRRCLRTSPQAWVALLASSTKRLVLAQFLVQARTPSPHALVAPHPTLR